MSHRPLSIAMLIRFLRVSVMYPSPGHTAYYKLRTVVFLFFLIDHFIMLACGLITLFSEFRQNIYVGIQGASICFGVINGLFKVVRLSLSDDFTRIIDRAENLFISLSKFPTADRLVKADDQIIAHRASLFWKFMLLFFPVSTLAAFYKVWFMGANSYLIVAFYTPEMPHFTLSMLWQIIVVTPVWFILTSYTIAFIIITSLIDTSVKCLMKLADQQNERVEKYIYKFHADIIMYGLVEEINKSLGPVLLFEMSISPLQSCFCAYGAMVAFDSRNMNGIYAANLMILSVALPCVLSASCQMVIDAGDNLHNSLHLLKWYERPAKEGRDIAFMALQVRRGLKLTYRRNFVFNMERFCEYLQCVMSYIAVMKNLKTK